MEKDQEMWEKLFHELACIKSEMKAFKLETRAELYQIKAELKEWQRQNQQQELPSKGE
ncbi:MULTISPECIES: hypothetical protein [Brevibacillus]|jgi:hypothetical protein|uniref:Uncharacterized protein n=1 Tax=Brevibacillus centrosporus TaxID=54910 RepID=A0A1I3VGW1_9BACL|nr:MULTISPECIES: hypothetical protein [Brevibacillus]MEC2130865.1 hypothetical protein [Brevibacillus centrosporus]MED1953413.1 hypothetical protein [Brevibacillus centrosporus]MED4908038.1 hypothetical protein [Brevibacillus centrosporus]SFJ94515.1 hypothetical protein SAMN05518846_1077 [Brevibacillus centrosporus]GED31408.1 hypothetical protein BCE02nite_25490 [Brevibacillus centrosporus]